MASLYFANTEEMALRDKIRCEDEEDISATYFCDQRLHWIDFQNLALMQLTHPNTIYAPSCICALHVSEQNSELIKQSRRRTDYIAQSTYPGIQLS
jgi:hypothetical protein